MTAILKVDEIQDTSGNNIINENAGTVTIGKSGDSVNLASGATAGFGKILQVVSATDSTERSTSSTSFVTASNTLSVNITPSSTSSKIFIISTFSGGNWTGGSNSAYYTIYRDSTNLAVGNNGMASVRADASGSGGIIPTSVSKVDTPNSTSQITYQIYVRSDGATVAINNRANITGTIVAMEIGA